MNQINEPNSSVMHNLMQKQLEMIANGSEDAGVVSLLVITELV
jgi:cytochrome c-type biogenesis protein CcmH/NrfF